MMTAERLAYELLDWNRAHLVRDAELTEVNIAHKFARAFVVHANGRIHPATHANYLEFLNGFRATIAQIDYQVDQIIADGSSAVVAMQALVQRVDGALDRFEAMLLLMFDADGLVTLWREVYLKIS